MTLEHRLVVGLNDIRAVTLECTKCQGRMTVAAPKLDQAHLDHCGFCGEPWLSAGMTQGRYHASDLMRFILGIAPAQKSQQDGDSNVHVRILLEFDDPSR